MKIRTESLYFHPREYVGNNIEYRIGSSAALARFKETQSFILSQLAINPFHKFSVSAKEILLFKFDVWFDLLCEIEQYMLIKQSDATYEEIMVLAEQRSDYAYETLDKADCVESDFLKTYKELILILRPLHEETLESLLATDISPSSKFGSIVDLGIRALNHVLYVVQELDVIYYTDSTPMLNLDALSCDMVSPISSTHICSAIKRIDAYRKIRYFDEIIIKDYVEFDRVFDRSRLHEVLSERGIKYKLI